jgi:hypothetical protein
MRQDAVHFGLSAPSESFVICERDGFWVVFYAERGKQQGLQTFETESDASEYLLNKLRRDPTTRR